MSDVTRFSTVPLLIVAGLAFCVAYRLFGSNSQTGIKLTVVVGFFLLRPLGSVGLDWLSR